MNPASDAPPGAEAASNESERRAARRGEASD